MLKKNETNARQLIVSHTKWNTYEAAVLGIFVQFSDHWVFQVPFAHAYSLLWNGPWRQTNQEAVKCPSSQPWNALLTQERKLRQVYFLHTDMMYNQYNQSQYWNSAGVVCLVPCTGTRCRQCKSQSSVVHETTLCYEENVTTHLKSALCCTEMSSLIEIPYDFREHFSSSSFW